MAVGVTLTSGNINVFFNSQIEEVLHSFDLSLLKDRTKQKELEGMLNRDVAIGTWTVQLTGNTIRLTVTGPDKRSKLQFSY